MNEKILYKKDSKGKIRVWKVWTENELVLTEFGVLDGKIQQSSYTCEAKNIGKTNEISPVDQAKLEMERLWVKKQEDGYAVEVSQITNDFKPMLAHPYKDQDITGWFAQPKLDGFRCTIRIEDGKVIYLSRSGKPITTVEYLNSDVLSLGLKNGETLDGELYLHGVSFEQLSSYIKKNHENDPKVNFCVFDIVSDPNMEFQDRWNRVTELSFTGNLHFVETWVLKDLEQELADWLEQGFEGLILRNPTGVYQYRRSRDLLKVKNFVDEEFEIINIETGKGKFEVVPIFTCKTSTGQPFNCVVAGTREQMAEYLSRKDLIGQLLTVKFQNKSEDGVPRFPVGIRIREPE